MIAVREIDGRRVAFVLADPPEDAPPAVREGVARRNLVATGGTCPCGAQFTMPNRAERRRNTRRGVPCHVDVQHEQSCPAVDETLTAAIARWRR